MRMVLQVRDLWEVVNGEEVKPKAEKAALAWEKKARKALATIALALSAPEKEHIIECTTPKAAWDVLEGLLKALMSKVRNTEGDCHYCGQKGHWKRDCPVRKYREEKGHDKDQHEGGGRKSARYSM